jgi:hypothetical protein
MFKIEIRSSKNSSLTKSKIYQTEKSLDIWLSKMAKRWCSLGNGIVVSRYVECGWISIPELYKESTR